MVLTSKGRMALLRPLEQADLAALVDFLAQLSEQTYHLRFGRPAPRERVVGARQEAARLLAADPVQHPVWVAVATALPGAAVLGVAEAVYNRQQQSAEIALTVRDDYQGEGLGTRFAVYLRERLLSQSILRICADIQSGNTAVFRLFHKLGIEYTADTRRGETHVVAQLSHKQAGYPE